VKDTLALPWPLPANNVLAGCVLAQITWLPTGRLAMFKVTFSPVTGLVVEAESDGLVVDDVLKSF
jgi:hypothetical protein